MGLIVHGGIGFIVQYEILSVLGGVQKNFPSTPKLSSFHHGPPYYLRSSLSYVSEKIISSRNTDTDSNSHFCLFNPLPPEPQVLIRWISDFLTNETILLMPSSLCSSGPPPARQAAESKRQAQRSLVTGDLEPDERKRRSKHI